MAKIAHLTTVASSLRYLLAPQLQALLDRGHETYGISAPGPDVAVLEEMGVRHIPLGSSTRGMDPAADLRSALELWRILRRERFDLLHTHNPKPGVYGRVLGRLAGVPAVVNTTHGLYATPGDRLVKQAVVYGAEALASRCSHAELHQNVEDLELVRRWRLSPPARTALLGNGIDVARFDPADHDRRAARSAIGAHDDRVVVGMVGRLVREKGVLDLLEAKRHLEDDVEVVIVGPEDHEKADALRAADLESSGVRLLGHRDDVEALYAAFDIFVLPSHREGFPRATMEAAAMALPVVATDIRGCRQVVEHERTGLLVPARDPLALAGAIGALAADQPRRAQMGAAGRDKALAEFDERRVVSTVLSTYDRLLGGNPAGGAQVSTDA